MKKIFLLLNFLSAFAIAQNGINYTPPSWKLTGNSNLSYTNNFLGTTDATSILYKTNNRFVAKMDSLGVLRLFPATGTTSISGSILYDNILNGLSVKTNTADQTWQFGVDNGVCNTAMLSNFLTGGGAVYNGAWIGTTTNDNLHLFTNGNGGGVPALTVVKQAGNAPIILNGFTTYTSSAILRITAGGLANYLECEGTQGVFPFRIIRRSSPSNIADLSMSGYATIGSTVITAGQPTLNVVGNAVISSSAAIGGLSLTAGSMTVATKTINTTAGDAATINSPAGRFRKDNTGSSFTLTNSLITANSIVVLTLVSTGITTGNQISIQAGAGTATITFETGGVAAAPSANCDVNFYVIN